MGAFHLGGKYNVATGAGDVQDMVGEKAAAIVKWCDDIIATSIGTDAIVQLFDLWMIILL